jgi:bifunctional isochorismate lyase/aryl carrier protein
MAIPAILPYSMPMAADFPKNKVSWKADPKRSVLLIHDMQQYFLNAYTSGASPLTVFLDNIRTLKTQCAELGIPVVYTAQPGSQTSEERGLLRDFWGAGLADDPEQSKIADSVAPGEKDTVFTKWRYSAFKRSKLLEYMQEQGRDQLIICGVYAHIGCLLTSCDAFMQDLKPFLVGDAVADFSLEHHTMAMKYAADNCGVIISTELLLKDLKEKRRSADIGTSGPNFKIFTLQLLRQQVAVLLGETITDMDDNENLIDKGLDSIRIMSLVEKWRIIGTDVTFVKLAKEPTIAAWWDLLSS